MYFGLAGGFNARARAANFEDGELGEVMAYLHARGVKGFVTLNVLVRSRPMHARARSRQDEEILLRRHRRTHSLSEHVSAPACSVQGHM